MVLSVIEWMVQYLVVGVVVVVIVACIAIGISVWNAFVLRDIQPRHFLSV